MIKFRYLILSLLSVVERSVAFSCSAQGESGTKGVRLMCKVFTQRLQDGYAGFTDGENIWVDDRLNAVQLMCTLLHELIHIEWGHTGHQREEVEMAVRYETARRLLPLDRLREAHTVGADIGMVARELGVTRQVLMDRAATLTDSEAAEVGCWACLKCPAIAARFNHRALVAA